MRLRLRFAVGQRQVRLAGCFGVRPGANLMFVSGDDRGQPTARGFGAASLVAVATAAAH